MSLDFRSPWCLAVLRLSIGCAPCAALQNVKSDFDDFVKRQQAEQAAAAVSDPKQELDEWLGYLDALYKQIAAYLQEWGRANRVS